MPDTLQLILILLGASVVVIVGCRLLHLPTILGYLVVGIAVGPHALAWVPDSPQTRYIGEFGVVFLMFSIGLEFSLAQLKAMRQTVFGLGLAQVLVTLAAGAVLTGVVTGSWLAGFALGGALAMSSTAIVSKMLAERMELTSRHGRDSMGILLFQDLAVVPLLIIVPTFARGDANVLLTLGLAAVKVVIALGLILVFGQPLMRAWFHVVARQRSSELFMLNMLLVTLGLATVTEVAGLSLALGAFLAGMLIAETEFRYQVEEDIKPFRDVLLGLFFVSIGMRLDLHEVAGSFGWVLVLVLGGVLFKLVSIFALARAFGAPLATALRTGFYLAHAGEFAFVLLAHIFQLNLVAPAIAQPILAAMLLSMLSAPIVIQFSDRIVRKLTANDWLARAAELTQIAARTMGRENHVIVCGFGRSGQNLARILETEDIPYVALDDDPQRVREAAADGSTVVYGDATRRDALVSAGLAKARALVVSFTDTGAALKILHQVRSVNATVPVVVRTVDDSDIQRLLEAGATEVVPEILEGSLMLASHSLLLTGTPLNRVLRRIRAVREERYSLFRGFYHGATDEAEGTENMQPRLHTVVLPERAAAVGRTFGELELRGLVEVTGIRRTGGRSAPPAPDQVLEAGDVLVLLGRPKNLAIAERVLLHR
jgi:CPA2 family monovalent cation:H+ antiporter-2